MGGGNSKETKTEVIQSESIKQAAQMQAVPSSKPNFAESPVKRPVSKKVESESSSSESDPEPDQRPGAIAKESL